MSGGRALLADGSLTSKESLIDGCLRILRCMRILLAEDNLDLSQWIARLLRRDHYVIDCVHRGELPVVRISSHWYFERQDVDRWIEARKERA